MPHFTCPQSTHELGEHCHTYMLRGLLFLFPPCHYADLRGTDSLAKATSEVSEDRQLQQLLLHTGCLSARQLNSHSQSHMIVI